MALRLPPLNTLRIFEAAGRLLSFKETAEELRVTPSAVSHAIHTLEDWLGVHLFARTSRGLALTDVGTAYLPYVHDALILLARGTESVPGRRSEGTLSVSVAPTFATWWLIPNLPKFKAAHPNIEVSLDTAHRQVQFPLDGVDVAIRLGHGPWPGLHAVKLATLRLSPVCAPGFKDLSILKTPQDLGKTELIHVTSVTEDWATWCASVGLELDLSKGLKLDTIHLATDTAIQSLGVALGRRPLIDPALQAKRLVQIFPHLEKSSTSYWLVCADESVGRRDIAVFNDWMREAFSTTGGT